MKCPKCDSILDKDSNTEVFKCESCGSKISPDSLPKYSTDDTTSEHAAAAPFEIEEKPTYVSQLPDKFLVDDPDFIDTSLSAWKNTDVLLPDGAGGITRVERNIVKIQHRGETVELIKLSAEEKKRRQFWINLFSIALAILFVLLLFFWFN